MREVLLSFWAKRSTVDSQKVNTFLIREPILTNTEMSWILMKCQRSMKSRWL